MKTKDMSKQQRPDNGLVVIFSGLFKRRVRNFKVAAMMYCSEVAIILRGRLPDGRQGGFPNSNY
jgi:hypothetical protein